MEQPEEVRLSEILIAPKTPAKPAAVARRESGPARRHRVIPAETDAALAAAKAKAAGCARSDSQRREVCGPGEKILRWTLGQRRRRPELFQARHLAKELEDKVFAMKAGEITDVIRTKQGYVILQVSEHQMAGIPTLKEVEPRIQDALYMQKLQPALRAYLTTLREDAFIDYKPGYVDTGASAKQTKPVETTEKENKAKKLKKKKKLGVF